MLLKLCLQIMFDDLINDLNLIVGLRMINRREVLLNAEFVVESPKFVTVKFCVVIINDLPRYSVLAYYCLPYKVLDLLTGDHGERFGFCPLCEIIDSDHNVLEGRSRCG